MIQIRFTAQGSNSLVGGFSTGDVQRVSEALAKHLVEEARVAEYVTGAAPAKAAGSAKGKAKPAAEAITGDSKVSSTLRAVKTAISNALK